MGLGGGGGGVGELWGGGCGVRGVDGWGILNIPYFFSTLNFVTPSRWEGEYHGVARLLPSYSLLDPTNKGL